MTFDEIIAENYTEEEKTELKDQMVQALDYLLATRVLMQVSDRLLAHIKDPLAFVEALRDMADHLEDIFGDEQEC